MKIGDIENFVSLNSVEQVQTFFNACYEKLNKLNKRCQLLTLYGMVIIIIYFLFMNSKSPEIQLPFFKITDFAIIERFTPLAFAYILFEWSLTDSHRTELLDTLKWLANKIYNLPNSADKYLYELLPFSLFRETGRYFNSRTITGNLSIIFLFLFVNWIPVTFLAITFINSFKKADLTFLNVSCNSLTVLLFVFSYIFQAKKMSTDRS